MKYILAAVILMILGACTTKKKDSARVSNTYYTCSMHPQIMEEKPGKCPICGMNLIAVQKNQQLVDGGIMLSDQQVQLGNILVDTVGIGKIGNSIVLNATLNIDETKSTAVSSRIAGRIDKLYFKNAGDNVKKGDKLYDLYSEVLNNAKQEYILALEKERVLDHSIVDFKQLVDGAKNKLLLWGMTPDQIKSLSKSKQASPLTSFYSPFSGTITTFESHEGEYISEGGTILRLSDLSQLWAEAQVYTSQLSEIDTKGTVMIQMPDLGREIAGHIELVNPEVNPDSRINLIRVAILNKNEEFKPGMPAYVTITNRENKAITLPAEALIRNEKNSIVWLQIGKNTFKPVIVETGKEGNDQIEILKGLKKGDIVVTSGAYLLYSEFIFKKGTTPNHKMSQM
jgi:membrane fusion protein, copper/silver efflux system